MRGPKGQDRGAGIVPTGSSEDCAVGAENRCGLAQGGALATDRLLARQPTLDVAKACHATVYQFGPQTAINARFFIQEGTDRRNADLCTC